MIEILPDLHKEVHRALYAFENGWLAPKRGYNGNLIQRVYSAKQLQDGLTRFYNGKEEFKIFLEPLKKAIEYTGN